MTFITTRRVLFLALAAVAVILVGLAVAAGIGLVGGDSVTSAGAGLASTQPFHATPIRSKRVKRSVPAVLKMSVP